MVTRRGEYSGREQDESPGLPWCVRPHHSTKTPSSASENSDRWNSRSTGQQARKVGGSATRSETSGKKENQAKERRGNVDSEERGVCCRVVRTKSRRGAKINESHSEDQLPRGKKPHHLDLFTRACLWTCVVDKHTDIQI